MLSISSGYSPEYLLKEVATGRENYYTGTVAEGEPPGRWWGGGAEKLGLCGLVDAQDMRAVYERFLDPRDAAFRDPERWEGASTLGHTGRKYLSEDELYERALEREPDASPERRAELRTEAGKAARHNVAFFDLTFSVQKSVTLLHTAFEAEEVKARNAGDEVAAAAWGEYRRAVEDAIWAGNNAMLEFMTEKAGYARVGHHGGAAGRWVDAHDWTVASFFQHDSRDHDPQLHVHNAALNRVEGPDGQWRTIDGRSIYRWRAAGAAVGERTCEERLAHTVGVRLGMRPDGKAREVLGVSQTAMDLISSRRRAVTAMAAELIEAYEQRSGRAANGLVRDRLQRQATFATRRAKSHDGETREQLLERVERQLHTEVAGGLSGVARAALTARDSAPGAQSWSPQAVIETALEEVQASKAGWTEADLIRALNNALPDNLGLTDGREVADLLTSLAGQALRYAQPLDGARPGDEALPAGLRLANGASCYQAPGARLYATPGHVRTERALLEASASADGAALRPDQARRFLAELADSGIKLGADQAAAVRGVLTSGARVETLVGPPGTGKSFVVGTIARGWIDPTLTLGRAGDVPDDAAGPRNPPPGRRVFGLATAQGAADVLKAEGLTARNVAAWLGAQRRLAATPGGPLPVEGDQAWRLLAGDLVVVDESAMTDTAALAQIHQYVDAAGAKLLLVGDHKQLAAVGAGGAMELIAGSGARYELADARRFEQPWEQKASLRLRAGDESVLREYHKRGRLVDGGTVEDAEAAAIRGWFGDTLSGKRSLLIVDTNDQAARVSAKIRAELVRLGHVEEHGVQLGLQGTYAGVGDLVEARTLDWSVRDIDGKPRPAVTREQYRVQAVRPDGGLEVAAIRDRTADGDVLGDRLVLPPEYVAEHLALGYASTKNAAQGATVHTSHTVATARTSPAGLLVPMTRGRERNTAYVVTVAEVADPAQGGARHTLRRDPVAVLARVLDTGDAEEAANRSATATAEAAAAAAGNARTAAELLADAAHLAATERTVTWLDQLVDKGWLTGEQRAQIAAEDGAATLTRVLRRAELAGHNPQQVLDRAVVASSLDGARNATNVLYSRIREAHRFDPAAESFSDLVPQVDNPEWAAYLAALARAGDDRARTLGDRAVAEPPSWAVEAFGQVPDDGPARQDWQRRVATVATYRELSGQDAADVPAAATPAGDMLGRAPKPGQVEAYAAYRAAWWALGRPEVDRAAYEMSDGQLRVLIRAWEREEAFGPRYVGNELAGTRQAAASNRHTAALRTAEADAATEPEERERLRQEAADAAALADTLDARAEQLEEIDDARAVFLAHTAVTRANAEEARFVLAERHADDQPERQVTAQEWLAAARVADAVEDPHREIVDEADLADVAAARDADLAAAVPTMSTGSPDIAGPEAVDESPAEAVADDGGPHPDAASNTGAAAEASGDDAVSDEVAGGEVPPETGVEDIRDFAAREPKQRDEDVVRVPAAEETAADLEHARRALFEIQARAAEEERQAAEEREQQLTRWHTEDATALHERDARTDGLPGDDTFDAGPALQDGAPAAVLAR